MGHKDFYRIKRQSVWIQTERHWLTESRSQILKIQANPVTHKHRINKNEVWYLGLFSLLTIFNSSFLIFSDKKWYAFMKWIINGTIGERNISIFSHANSISSHFHFQLLPSGKEFMIRKVRAYYTTYANGWCCQVLKSLFPLFFLSYFFSPCSFYHFSKW